MGNSSSCSFLIFRDEKEVLPTKMPLESNYLDNEIRPFYKNDVNIAIMGIDCIVDGR